MVFIIISVERPTEHADKHEIQVSEQPLYRSLGHPQTLIEKQQIIEFSRPSVAFRVVPSIVLSRRRVKRLAVGKPPAQPHGANTEAIGALMP